MFTSSETYISKFNKAQGKIEENESKMVSLNTNHGVSENCTTLFTFIKLENKYVL